MGTGGIAEYIGNAADRQKRDAERGDGPEWEQVEYWNWDEEDEVIKRTKGVALKGYWVSNHSFEDSPVVSINPDEYQ